MHLSSPQTCRSQIKCKFLIGYSFESNHLGLPELHYHENLVGGLHRCEQMSSIATVIFILSHTKPCIFFFLDQVNLDSTTREETTNTLLQPTHSCFDQAQHKIFILMEKDSYRRFLKSHFYLDLMSPTSGGNSKKMKGLNTDSNPFIPQCA